MSCKAVFAVALVIMLFPESWVTDGSVLTKVPGLGLLSTLSQAQLVALAVVLVLAMLAGGWGKHPFSVRQWPPPVTAPEQYNDAGLGPLRENAPAEELYLDTLKRTLTNIVYESRSIFRYSGGNTQPSLRRGYDLTARSLGEDSPAQALTMIGARRLENLQTLINRIVDEDIQGDVLEAGCLNGGSAMFMTAVLRTRNQLGPRRVFLADAFSCNMQLSGRFANLIVAPIFKFIAWVPSVVFQRAVHKILLKASGAFPPSTREAPDDFMKLSRFLCKNLYEVSNPDTPMPPNTVDQVKSYFARMGLLHPAVRFLPGFFADTLPTAPVDRLALLRADGDTYESTRDILENLYEKVVPGGFVVIDDYHSFQECREAVDEFRAKVNDTAEMVAIDKLAVYWRKP